MAKNLVMHGRIKHTELKHQFISDVANGLISVNCCNTNDQVGDGLTKAFSHPKFLNLEI